jgi:hypothetical protein
MAMPGYEYLSAYRLTRVMQTTADRRQLPQTLKFVRRTEKTPATEGELFGRWTGRVLIADLISDDARALTYSAGKLSLETSLNPNIKHGRHLTQEQINQLEAINSNPGFPAGDFRGMAGSMPNEFVDNIIPAIADDLQLGIEQRREALLVAMHLDSAIYNRMGMKITAGWGTPADLKVTPVVAWTDAANATPVNDIWNLKRNASVRWGKMYNRLIMSTSAFMLMIATTEFQNKARTTLPLFINYTNIPQGNLNFQQDIAKNILGIDALELYDSRYWSQDAEGNIQSAPYLPINKVILDSTENDNNRAVQDFSDGVVTESRLMNLLPSAGTGIVGGSIGAGQRGPVAYATVPHDMNPPNLTIWGVSRGWPRRFEQPANAVLTVGTFVDSIPITEVA